ncbi:DNA replication and repair protein RecF [Hypnocyclicus thermotrophus]|uniref:DNA replication and repair protein RecF n=1 Tax=Hypnocyclicus thermotrophus TaxID=1627895 RepID=A0AA46DYB8_9FUSO|nr:DNA replication and repair protein RecF [Hypnocyclicus thermotrophus]TDT69834.1 DNA replication and repair protein RecF [Hypnocyclicus thermotrophus]
MFIKNLSYFNFRNLIDGNLEFDKKFNLFLGKNGQGKTSVLESIYFTITGQSFRTKNIKDIIKYEKLKLATYLEYEDKFSEKNIAIKTISNKKEYFYNKKKVTYDEYLGRLNVISFIPEDINLIIGSPMNRRNFFDYEISQGNTSYYIHLKNYNKILKIRNTFFKNKDFSEIFEIYNQKFFEEIVEIVTMRYEYIKKISILLNLNYRKLFDNKSELILTYKNSFGDITKLNKNQIMKKLLEYYKKIKDKEKKYGYSLIGPQKDDFLFLLNGKEAKSFSSQGEKKSIIFALKISEIDMLIKEKSETPIFLIDDISSYFDSIRKESIIKYFENREIQLFLSSTDDLGINSKKFKIFKGDVNG